MGWKRSFRICATRFGWSSKSPGVTAIALLTIGIATGANATVFGFVSALLLRPAPGVADPRSLVAIYTSDYSSGPYGESSYPDYLSLKRDAAAFAAMAAEQGNAAGVVRVDDRIERVGVSSVSGEYFGLLGVAPALGRLITQRRRRRHARRPWPSSATVSGKRRSAAIRSSSACR